MSEPAQEENQPGRPTVEEKILYYWVGEGWKRAFREAKRILAAGRDIREAAAHIGCTEEELRRALRSGDPPGHKDSPPDLESPSDLSKPPRAKRTVRQRVDGLTGISTALMNRAKRMYEVEFMTVREVSEALGEPYEKTYLLLIKAVTKFRRPGRRPSSF